MRIFHSMPGLILIYAGIHVLGSGDIGLHFTRANTKIHHAPVNRGHHIPRSRQRKAFLIPSALQVIIYDTILKEISCT